MPKFAHDRWFAYARRHEYQIGVHIQKTCVRKDKNTAPGQNYGRIYLVLFTKPVHYGSDRSQNAQKIEKRS